jgi:hypothetical protein
VKRRPSDVPVDAIREAAAHVAALTSVRSVSRDIGISPRGLQKFLDGGEPYSPNRAKLQAWYVRKVADGIVDPVAGAENAAVDLLLRGISPRKKEKARAALLDALRRIYADAGAKTPGGLGELAGE